MTQSGQIQIEEKHLISALRAENANLREQNTNLQAFVLQIQEQANNTIAALQSQVKSYQEAEAAKPIPTDELFTTNKEGGE